MVQVSHWCRVAIGGATHIGRVHDDHIELCRGDMFNDPRPTGERIDVQDAVWLPPVVPDQFLGLWNNLHARQQVENTLIPGFPLYFVKLADSVSAHLRDIPWPDALQGAVKFEAELGIVIGRRCHRLSANEVDDAIFGYTCVNDVTAPQVLFDNPEFPQWCRAKSYPGFGPIGPVIARGIDPDSLQVQGILDGAIRQDYPVSDMIFSPREIVRMISQEITLQAGDVIACGTSLGADTMQRGQTIEIHIAGIGTLRNTVR